MSRLAAGSAVARIMLGSVLLAAACGVVQPQTFSPASHADVAQPESTEEIVTSLVKLIEDNYFDRTAIPNIRKSLLDADQQGRFRDADASSLAKRFTETLYQSSHDKHLYVLPTQGTPSSPSSLPRSVRSRMENFGFVAADILSGNVGYLKVNAFYRASEGEASASAAMNFLRHTDALILDLRDNGGGSPDTAIQLLSYFFDDANLTILRIVPRAGEPTEYTTNVKGVSFRRANVPLYVLVSTSTWSAGEAVTYALQERHRAVIVGETTAGAANPASSMPLSAGFTVNIPFGRIESGVRKSNWEGKGVQPDIPCPRKDALWKAHLEALKVLAAANSNPAEQALLVEAIRAESSQHEGILQ